MIVIGVIVVDLDSVTMSALQYTGSGMLYESYAQVTQNQQDQNHGVE